MKRASEDSGSDAHMSPKPIHTRWHEQGEEENLPGLTRRFITSKNVMIGNVRLKKGAVVPPHRHVHEQFTLVIDGALSFTFDELGDSFVVHSGEAVFIPSNVLHGLEALRDTVEFDIFNPPREDWINKNDPFLRRNPDE
jgi:quercetin dioxygenase-like cupin family protein